MSGATVAPLFFFKHSIMNKYYLIAFLVLNLIFLYACNKEDESLTKTCPVDYEYTEVNFKKEMSIEQRWRFVGFEDKSSKEIQDPPCRTTPITIAFADTIHDNSNSEFYLPYLMKGTMLINKFTSSYEVAEEGRAIEVSRVIASQVKGQNYVSAFEEKFIDGIQRMNSFEIEGNTLRLKNESKAYDLLFYAY